MSGGSWTRWARGRPASLRGRVVLGVLALLAVLLVGLFVAVDLALGARLRSDLRTRLEDRVELAEQLDGALQPQQLVDRLTGDGLQVVLCTAPQSGTSPQCVSPHLAPRRSGARGAPPGGTRFGGPPARPSVPVVNQPAIVSDGSTLYVRTTLPVSRQVLSLSVDSAQVGATIGRLVLFELIGGLLCLLVAALLLGHVVGRALRPLDRMTSLARSIAAGEPGARGRRLGVPRRNTELGRTAAAFDDMLDELETALERAAAAQARLRQFLGDASHELRSPLAGVQSTAEMLLRREPDRTERERAYVALIRETRRASRLVDDLLTVARFDVTEAAPLAVEPTDLVEIAAAEVDRARSRASQVSITVDGNPTAPVIGDPLRLGQIVSNLLDNARQATPPGGRVHVEVWVGDHSCVLDVRDTGPGIADVDSERVFERLVRLDSSRSRDTGGFGLGLPIARALAYAHGGDLCCVPGAGGGGGGHFRLTLPRRTDVDVADQPVARRANAAWASATV
jgi:two-component system OmpR family sensor kinase